MADNVDSVLRAEHALSERWRPKAADVAASLSNKQRAQLVAWMLQTFDVLALDDALFHSATLTLDRYYAGHPGPVDQADLECLILSAVCTEFKTSGGGDWPESRWKQMITHLSQGRIPLLQILQNESEMLSRLGYVVSLPTPLSFLQSLGIRLRGDAQAPAWLALATFLLELALLDPELEYRWSHSHLAAGALRAAYRVLDAPLKRRQELLYDVTSYWPVRTGTASTWDIVLHIEEELLDNWVRLSMGMGDFASFFPIIQNKFKHQARHGVALLSPAVALNSLREERNRTRQTSRAACSGTLATAAATMLLPPALGLSQP